MYKAIFCLFYVTFVVIKSDFQNILYVNS